MDFRGFLRALPFRAYRVQRTGSGVVECGFQLSTNSTCVQNMRASQFLKQASSRLMVLLVTTMGSQSLVRRVW